MGKVVGSTVFRIQQGKVVEVRMDIASMSPCTRSLKNMRLLEYGPATEEDCGNQRPDGSKCPISWSAIWWDSHM
jgi:hypothetical protein